MEKEELEKLKSKLPEYLTSKGINFERGKLFSCLSPTHLDKHPSMVYYSNKQSCHCFACGANLDIFNLIQIDYGLNKFTEQADKIREIYGYTTYKNESFKNKKRSYSTFSKIKENIPQQNQVNLDFRRVITFKLLENIPVNLDSNKTHIQTIFENKNQVNLDDFEGEEKVSVIIRNQPYFLYENSHYELYDEYLHDQGYHAIDENMTFDEWLNEYIHESDFEKYGIHPEEEKKFTDFSKYLTKCRNNLENKEYLDQIFPYINQRGLSLETVKHFGCGFDPYWRSPKALDEGRNVPYSPRLIIPSSNSGYLARDTRDNLNEYQLKYQKMKAGELNLFNKQALHNEKGVCFITEGEIDAMSIYEAGFQAVALGSTAMVEKLLQTLKENGTNCTLIPLLDNDTAGKEATLKIEEALINMNIPFYHVDKFCFNAKDSNEALCFEPEFFKTWVRNIALSAWFENNNYNEKNFLNTLTKKCVEKSKENIIYTCNIEKKENESNVNIKEIIYFDNQSDCKIYSFTIHNTGSAYTVSDSETETVAHPLSIKSIIEESLKIINTKTVSNSLQI